MSKNNKQLARLKRARKTRAKIARLGVNRLSVHRSSKHIYAQIVTPCGDTIITHASSIDKSLKSDINNGGNIEAAKKVGDLLAQRCKEAGVESVAFDRSGYKYHGRVKALADAVRAGGIEF